MKLKHLLAIGAVAPFLACSVSAQQKPKRWEAMDYGPFLSATINNAQGQNRFEGQGCATDKGIAVRLGENGEGTMLFDTDLLRMSGGWTGGWLKLQGVAFDGKHGPNPQPADGARIFFQTNPGPGWSNGDDFQDPRAVPKGPGAAKIPFGPLPKTWAKYRGLYLSGSNVVLSYTVGSAPVLESPGIEKIKEQVFLTRTFNVVDRGGASTLLAAEGPYGTSASIEGGTVIVNDDPANPESRLAIAVSGAPPDARWEVIPPSRIHLRLPAFTGTERFKLLYWKGTQADIARFMDAAKEASAGPILRDFTKGGPTRWKETVATQGKLGSSEGAAPYVVDTVALPFENPAQSWMRTTGFDFLPDGRAAVCTWNGDVWLASGIDERLEEIRWKRYATGLFQPLGLKVLNGKVYVLGRDQITRLEDRNEDDEADFYESFNNDVQVTPAFHEFALDLQADTQGNLYFAKGGPVNPGGRGWGPLSDHHGSILKVSHDGTRLEVFATGVRAPNGMAVGPNDEVTVSDNQGTWVPACYLHIAKPGDFLSVVDLAHRDPPPAEYGRHICFFPMNVDNSSGSQVWVTSDRWGPLKGKLLHLSYGKSALLGTLMETVNGTVQGGVFRFPLKFNTGICRARFNERDGQLYVCGLRGWQTDGTKDGALQRIRYTGHPVHFPEELHVTDKGVQITFTSALDPVTAGDPQSYSVEQWNYRWTQEYGSADYKVSEPAVKGHDVLTIQSVTLSSDRKSVFLGIPGLRPVMQMQISMNIKAADGTPLPDRITNTINEVASSPEATPLPSGKN